MILFEGAVTGVKHPWAPSWAFRGSQVLSGKWLGDRPLNKSASLYKIILLFFKKVLYFYAEKN